MQTFPLRGFLPKQPLSISTLPSELLLLLFFDTLNLLLLDQSISIGAFPIFCMLLKWVHGEGEGSQLYCG